MTAPRRKTLIRLAAAVLVVAFCALLAEGAASLLLGRSLFRWITGREGGGAPGRMRMFDEERVRAAALSEGPFAADPDPLVSLRMKSSFTSRLHDVPASTDPRGLRTRVGPEPDPKAQRIVVLGDSIAFGFGLKDDETIAHHLEQFLAGATAPGEPRPIAITAACPGWTLQNSQRFLLDRLDDLKPDVVLLLTVANDLDDSWSILESGHRAAEVDPALGVEVPACNLSTYASLGTFQKQLFPKASFGWYSLYSGVSPESRKRYAAAAARIGDLGARLAAAGAKLAVAGLTPGAYELRLLQSLRASGSTVSYSVVFDQLRTEDALDGDPHPNARCARAIAWRFARRFVDDGWVRGARADGLPAEDDRYAGRVGVLPDAAQLGAAAVEGDRASGAEIGPRVDFTDGTGWHQLYAGFWPDGMIGNAASAALAARGGSRLVLRIARFTGHAALYPLRVRVYGNDSLLDTLELAAPAPGEDAVMTKSIDVPKALLESGFLDVRLVTSEWIVQKVQGVSRLAAVQVLSLSIE